VIAKEDKMSRTFPESWRGLEKSDQLDNIEFWTSGRKRTLYQTIDLAVIVPQKIDRQSNFESRVRHSPE
jgi:hypothetical protein